MLYSRSLTILTSFVYFRYVDWLEGETTPAIPTRMDRFDGTQGVRCGDTYKRQRSIIHGNKWFFKYINVVIREIMLRTTCLVDIDSLNRIIYDFSMSTKTSFAMVDGLAAFNWVSPTFNFQTWTSVFNLPDTFPCFSSLFLGGNGT